MALAQAKKFGANIHALGVDSNDANTISKSVRRRYGSEVEVVDGKGKLLDVIFSGEELTETTTKTATNIDNVGDGDINTGIITRSSVRFSNEDVSKVETEKLRIPLSNTTTS
jgi:hypothetical protein